MDHGYMNDLVPVNGHFLDHKEVTRRSQTEAGRSSYILSYQENEVQDIMYRDVNGGDEANQPPLEFGRFSHPNADGRYRVRYFQGKDHGYARTHATEFECAKFNQRLNPRVNRVGNVVIGDMEYRRTRQDMVASTLAHFPKVGGLVTSAPFRLSGYSRQLPKADQPAEFMRLFGVGELQEMVLKHLFAHRESLSNFSRTCQLSFEMVQKLVTHLAVNTGDFQLLNKTEKERAELLEAGAITQEQIEQFKIPTFAMFTPVRGDIRLGKGFGGNPAVFYPPQVCSADAPLDQTQTHKRLFNRSGFRTCCGYDYALSARNPAAELLGYQQMLNTINMACGKVRHVTFERCPYLDLRTLSAIMDHMSEITTLGVYSCESIHLGTVSGVLELVSSHNQKRIKDDRNLIELDIAPPFRQGPIEGRYGSYGITHSDPSIWRGFGIDMGRALTAKLVQLERLARAAHVELFIPGKAFRSWLDKLPLQVNQLICILEAVANFLDCESSSGPMRQRMIDTVQMDLVIAATARPLLLEDFKRERPMLCGGCFERLPGAFFRAEVHSRDRELYRCEGCEITSQLEQETENGKFVKRRLIQHLWRRVIDRDHGDGSTVPRGDLDFLFSGSDLATNIWETAMEAAKEIPSNKEIRKFIAKLEKKKAKLSKRAAQLDDFRDRKPLNRELDNLKEVIESHRVLLGEQAKPGECLGTTYDWDYLRKAYAFTSQVQAGGFTVDGPYNMSTLDSYLKAFCMNN